MSDHSVSARPHSSEYFGEERDHLWNDDYLDLLAQRLELRSITSIVDVGCGVGHWSSLLYPRLALGANLVGVDSDLENLAGFRERFAAVPSAAARAVEGNATLLPFPNNTFEAATCQTLLIHVADPAQVVREMIRVTRPGGLILCVEPNNLVARFPSAWSAERTPIDRLLRLSEMAWLHALGRTRRGLGRDYLGELLPGLFAESGLQGIRVWLCDKASPIVAPYGSQAERAYLQSYRRWRQEGIGPFDRSEIRANVLAGGGSDAFFDAAWADYLAEAAEMIQAVEAQRWHGAGGTLLYVIAGHVPV